VIRILRVLPIKTVLQVTKDVSSTGFIKIIAVDNSPPHPAIPDTWNYIVVEYDPTNPEWEGKETRLRKDELTSIRIRNGI
jgi:hypothetical protein